MIDGSCLTPLSIKCVTLFLKIKTGVDINDTKQAPKNNMHAFKYGQVSTVNC